MMRNVKPGGGTWEGWEISLKRKGKEQGDAEVGLRNMYAMESWEEKDEWCGIT